jgi:hypothetical protein
MPWSLANPDRLFDRTWRPRHPMRPRLSLLRRRCMLTTLIVLCVTILGYGWLTDAKRVRAMAEIYLSDLLGGDVEIRRASLSIFEGLRLDDVTVRVDGGNRPDSTVFHAKTLLVKYNPAELLAGKITGTQIVAIDPTVILVQDVATQRWNYQRLWHGAGVPPRHNNGESNGPAVLPQIILRDAQVAYLELRGNRTQTIGWYSLEGSLSPGEEPDQYDFQLQSRGRESLGPSVDGTIRTDGGASVARLRNFTFGPDIKTMLLAEPREWCERHQLQGRIDVPEMVFTPGQPGTTSSFRLEISLSSVELAVNPDEWMSRRQNENLKEFHRLLDSVKPGKWLTPWVIDSLRTLSTPAPIHLRQVSGTLVFTEKGLELKSVNGRLENNWFDLDGVIDGYSPDAAASLTVSSMAGHDLEIPSWSPTYVGSLPPEVQEIYERLHPQGTCSVSVTLNRSEAGARPGVAGRVDIHDGEFRFADFPYPLSGATGTILIGRDVITGMDGIRVMNVRGHGLGGGPNENSVVSIDGFIGPFDQVAGIWLDVRARDICSEPALRSALPPVVDRALRLFDPEGMGALPTFRGDVTCHIVRAIGPHKHVFISTDVNLADAEGTLVAFPYRLKHVSGRIEVRDHYLNLIGITAQKGDASVAIDGKVTWRNDHDPPSAIPVGPDVHVVCKNLPIDNDLVNALPAMQRDWLLAAAAGGKLEVDGMVLPSRTPGTPADFDFQAKLHDGTFFPVGGAYALSGVSANLHITPTQFVLTDLSGQRGTGSVNGKMSVDWMAASPDGSLSTVPRILLSGTAKAIPLDAPVYAALPANAKQAWDEINPQGTIDAKIEYESALVGGVDPGEKLDLQIKPVNLAIKPRVFPYRMDDVQGALRVSPNRVVLENLTARHGNTTLAFSGHGDLGEHPQWIMKLSANPFPLDAEATAAVPDTVAQVIKTLKLTGVVGVDFSKLAYRPLPGKEAADLDFAAKITLSGAALDIGLPIDHAFGTMDVAGLVRDGNLHRLGVMLSADRLMLANRPASNFTAVISKPSDEPVIQVSRFGGTFAGGDLGGSGQFVYSDSPSDAPSGRYDFGVILHDADVAQLVSAAEQGVNGRLTASLNLDGVLNDPESRRGHGDVRVSGVDMYNLPVLLGLLQITNLALPLSSPFDEATTRYAIDGQQVIFDQITLKSKQMTMTGNGQLDFAAKRVSLWFVTDNPTLVSIPLFGALLHGAKQELLRIHVGGTIDQPTVEATSFHTIRTTVDQVLSDGDGK